MVDIGIIGAMDIEVAEIISHLENRKSVTFSGIKFHSGEYFGKTVVVAKCGVGKVFASLCAEAMILKFAPKIIVNTGVGGAIADGLKTGDVVIADKLCQHDMDTSAVGDPVGLVSGINKIWFESERLTVEKLLSSAKKLGLSASVGSVATGDTFVASPSVRSKIYEKFGASVCEMEGCSVAQVAFVNDVPFAVVRAISDSANGDASMDYPTFAALSANNSASLILKFIETL